MNVELTWDEMRLGGQIGVARRIESLRAGFGNDAFSRAGEWQVDILGALGEIVVAKALGVYWVPTVNTFKLPDLGQLNIRATEYAAGKLIVRPKDPPGIYVLVIVQGNKGRIPGWIDAREARVGSFKDQPDKTRPPCWAVPQDKLKPIMGLRRQGVPGAMALPQQGLKGAN